MNCKCFTVLYCSVDEFDQRIRNILLVSIFNRLACAGVQWDLITDQTHARKWYITLFVIHCFIVSHARKRYQINEQSDINLARMNLSHMRIKLNIPVRCQVYFV